MYSDFAVNKYLHTVVSGWIFINISEFLRSENLICDQYCALGLFLTWWTSISSKVRNKNLHLQLRQDCESASAPMEIGLTYSTFRIKFI